MYLGRATGQLLRFVEKKATTAMKSGTSLFDKYEAGLAKKKKKKCSGQLTAVSGLPTVLRRNLSFRMLACTPCAAARPSSQPSSSWATAERVKPRSLTYDTVLPAPWLGTSIVVTETTCLAALIWKASAAPYNQRGMASWPPVSSSSLSLRAARKSASLPWHRGAAPWCPVRLRQRSQARNCPRPSPWSPGKSEDRTHKRLSCSMTCCKLPGLLILVSLKEELQATGALQGHHDASPAPLLLPHVSLVKDKLPGHCQVALRQGLVKWPLSIGCFAVRVRPAAELLQNRNLVSITRPQRHVLAASGS